MKIHEMIRAKRLQMEMSSSEVASKCGLSPYEYDDLEYFEDEFISAIDVNHALRVCDVLGIPSSQAVELAIDASDRYLNVATEDAADSDVAQFLGIENALLTAVQSGPAQARQVPFWIVVGIANATGSTVESLIGL